MPIPLQCMKVKRESEVAQSCLTLCDPMNCSLRGSSVHGIFQARVLEWGAIAFSIFPSIGVFSNESALHISWPKDWSFSFSISPSRTEYSRLVFFLGFAGLISLQSKGLSRVFSRTTIGKHQFFSLLYGPTLTSIHDYWKNHSFDHMGPWSAE